ncbi:hypothetical protein ADH76_02315 [Enterocloster clostridioformis]|nr:hypothetical protein A4V08_02110 [Lachnoclostridium sp. YL32]OXE70309.1 hypothetical protein ADH76_02315 [Enterocloster clostridioformis]
MKYIASGGSPFFLLLLFSFPVNADSDFSVNAPNGYQAYNSPAAATDRKNAVFFIRGGHVSPVFYLRVEVLGAGTGDMPSLLHKAEGDLATVSIRPVPVCARSRWRLTERTWRWCGEKKRHSSLK